MFILEVKGRSWSLLCISIPFLELMLQPHEFSWSLLPSPLDGEPQVLGEFSLPGCIRKAILPPPALAMQCFPPKSCDYEMSPWKQLEYNTSSLVLPSPSFPLPPSSSLSKALLAVQEKPFSHPSSPQTCKGECLCLAGIAMPQNTSLFTNSSVALNLPNSTECYCLYQDLLPSSGKQ